MPNPRKEHIVVTYDEVETALVVLDWLAQETGGPGEIAVVRQILRDLRAEHFDMDADDSDSRVIKNVRRGC